MNTKVAFVFPGQGSQAVGMLCDIAQKYPEIKNVFAESSSILNYDLWELTQSGPEEKLNQTEFTQPALLTAEIALWRICKEKGFTPSFFAGHSLGEYSALVAADAISLQDAVALVRDRGRFMQEAYPPNQGGMVAVVGLDDLKLENICKEIANDLQDNNAIVPANYNSIGQTVLSGKIEAAKLAVQMAKAAGAKLAILLPVSVPSHCELMGPAAIKLQERLSQITINSPKIPVIHNVNVSYYNDPSMVKNALIKQLTKPVRWVETIQLLLNEKITEVYECGPGKVLTGLNKRIGKDTSVKFATISENLNAI